MGENNPCNPEHYSRCAIEPWDFIAKNNLDFMRGNVIKYLMRYDMKNGLEDLKKARAYLERIIANSGEKSESDNSPENIQRVWEVSLYNISLDDALILKRCVENPEKCEGRNYISAHSAGFFIAIDKDVEYPGGLSYRFYALIKRARRISCQWINLDEDAEPAEGFHYAKWQKL